MADVTRRTYSWDALCNAMEPDRHYRREMVYEFSNGRRFIEHNYFSNGPYEPTESLFASNEESEWSNSDDSLWKEHAE